MFAEELAKIRESEEKADQLQKKAKSDARQALKDAESKAEHIVEDAQAQARDIYDTLLKEGQDISDKEYQEALEAVQRACEAMAKRAEDNQAKAIEFITERIVRISVNH